MELCVGDHLYQVHRISSAQYSFAQFIKVPQNYMPTENKKPTTVLAVLRNCHADKMPDH